MVISTTFPGSITIMSKYQIGQDISQLQQRIEALERLLEIETVKTTTIKMEVRFERAMFKRTQGAITVMHVDYRVSSTAETVGSPDEILSMPLFSGFEGKEKSPGIQCAFPSVCFDVVFPKKGTYYRWVDVTFRSRAGTEDKILHDYINLQAFVI
jgi:hypothetical protein